MKILILHRYFVQIVKLISTKNILFFKNRKNKTLSNVDHLNTYHYRITHTANPTIGLTYDITNYDFIFNT